jgi:response regulator RpfG family c-di-GMP phosphodiesterase
MTEFKSEFLNIMQERGFYNQCTNIEGFDDYLSKPVDTKDLNKIINRYFKDRKE